MLIFLAGMTGFCLTGDIFDLFVWFELMGVAAYALTAYRRDRPVPLLARRRARGGAHPGLRAVLRRDGRTRPVRDRAGLLVGLRPGTRAPGGDLAPVPGSGRADGRGRRAVLLPRTARQATAGVLHH